MKFRFMFSALFLSLLASNVNAQHHGDIELGYDSQSTPSQLIIEPIEFTTDGFMFFESEFEAGNPFVPGDFFTDEPGFNTNAGEGLLVNHNDQIWLSAIDASLHSAFGLGYVNFYNPSTDLLEAFGRIEVEGNQAATTDLVLNGSFIESGDNPQFVDLGDSGGDIHDHVIFDLLDDGTAPFGAYGVMFQLQSDFDPADGNMDLNSDPFCNTVLPEKLNVEGAYVPPNAGKPPSAADSITTPGKPAAELYKRIVT